MWTSHVRLLVMLVRLLCELLCSLARLVNTGWMFLHGACGNANLTPFCKNIGAARRTPHENFLLRKLASIVNPTIRRVYINLNS